MTTEEQERAAADEIADALGLPRPSEQSEKFAAGRCPADMLAAQEVDRARSHSRLTGFGWSKASIDKCWDHIESAGKVQ